MPHFGALEGVSTTHPAPGGGGIVDIIHMMFNGANGGSVFTEQGTAGSVWTRSGAGVTTTTGAPDHVEGSAALQTTGSTQYLETPYAAANALQGGDWFIGFWYKPGSSLASKYLMGVEDAGGTVAGRAWLIYIDSGGVVNFFVSDGAVVSSFTTGPVVAGEWDYHHFERVGNTIFGAVGTRTPEQMAFAGTINLPGGTPVLRLGATPGGDQPAGSHFDMLQIRRSNIYGGGPIFRTPIP